MNGNVWKNKGITLDYKLIVIFVCSTLGRNQQATATLQALNGRLPSVRRLATYAQSSTWKEDGKSLLYSLKNSLGHKFKIFITIKKIFFRILRHFLLLPCC